MLRNYLAAALRNLVRNKLYAAINIVGLAVGFAAALLIALFVRDEFSYDKWIPGHENIYLLTGVVTVKGRAPQYYDFSPGDLAVSLKADFPEIDAVARLMPGGGAILVNDTENNEPILWADPGVFGILKFPTVAGDLAHALDPADGIVLTRAMALKYFGTENAIGRTLTLRRQFVMTVTAVIEDLPSNTHLNASFIASGKASFSPLTGMDNRPPSVNDFSPNAEILMRIPPAGVAKVRDGMPEFLRRHKTKMAEGMTTIGLSVELVPRALASLHLQSGSGNSMKPRGNRDAVLAIAGIGVMIVLIAVINFVNLMTARASRRAVEVGVRKASGATRVHLSGQFIGETMIYVALGMAAGIAGAVALLPSFNAFLGRGIALAGSGSFAFAGFMLAAMLVVGVLAGAYPAFVLTSFRPAVVLKTAGREGQGSSLVRHILVVLQFAVLTGLLVATGVVYRQSDFALNEGKRLDYDHVVAYGAACNSSFREAVRTVPGVVGSACTTNGAVMIGSGQTTSVTTPDGARMLAPTVAVGFGFFELHGIKPLAGRLFDESRPSDILSNSKTENASIIVNEAAARKLGFVSASSAVGQQIRLDSGALGFDMGQTMAADIIGVIPDYALDSVHVGVPPVVYYANPARLELLSIKLDGSRTPETVAALDKLWKQVGDPRPASRLFLDQYARDVFADITRQQTLFSAFAGVAAFIAVLGLFGMSVFVAERRAKEIGVRKAFGATRTEMVWLLIWQFTQPVVIANVIAWPVAYYVMNRWLTGFASHIDMEWWLFAGAALATWLIAVFTVATHAYRVAGTKPSAALRYE